MNIGNSISYILSNSSKLPQLFSGLSYFKNGGLSKSFSVIGTKGTHFDMRMGQETVYTGWSMLWWTSAISVVLTNLLSIIFNGFSFSNITNILFGAGVSLIIYSIFISKGRENETHWKSILVKLLIICHLCGLVSYIILIGTDVIGAVVGLIGSLVFLGVKYAIYTILGILVNLLVNVAGIFISLYILNGFNAAIISSNGAYNGNMNYNGNYNGSMNSNYNPNFNNVDNLSGLGAVNTTKNQSIGQDNTGFNQQNGFNSNINNGFNQNNGFNPNNQNGFNSQNNFNPNNNQNNFNQQNNFNMNNQNVQMYACPYCGNPIVHGANPCPHCNNPINWGM